MQLHIIFNDGESFFFDVSWVLDYPIVSIEEPFDMEDWEQVKYFSELGICQVCS